MIFFLDFLVSFRSTTNLEIQDESYFGGFISWLLKSCWCKKHKLSKFQGAKWPVRAVTSHGSQGTISRYQWVLKEKSNKYNDVHWCMAWWWIFVKLRCPALKRMTQSPIHVILVQIYEQNFSHCSFLFPSSHPCFCMCLTSFLPSHTTDCEDDIPELNNNTRPVYSQPCNDYIHLTRSLQTASDHSDRQPLH